MAHRRERLSHRSRHVVSREHGYRRTLGLVRRTSLKRRHVELLHRYSSWVTMGLKVTLLRRSKKCSHDVRCCRRTGHCNWWRRLGPTHRTVRKIPPMAHREVHRRRRQRREHRSNLRVLLKVQWKRNRIVLKNKQSSYQTLIK